MKKWLIIGSVALRHWFDDAREPKDIDILTPAKITGCERDVAIIESQWHDAADYIIENNGDPVFGEPNMLYTIKVSHAHWNVKWDKTMYDVQFLKRKGATLLKDVYDRLIPIWTEIHGKKHVNMNKSMDEFFKDAVNREYDHELLHELVAFGNRPLHESIRPDLSNAWCSEELFMNLPRARREMCALEEMMATAIERSRLTENSSKIDILRAMNKAHFQLCTSMTKGWFARFLIENKYELLSRREEWMPQITEALSNLPKPTQ